MKQGGIPAIQDVQQVVEIVSLQIIRRPVGVPRVQIVEEIVDVSGAQIVQRPVDVPQVQLSEDIVDERTIETAKSPPYNVSIGFPFFALSTFNTNGGQLFLATDTGTVTIEKRQISIHRISSGQL